MKCKVSVTVAYNYEVIMEDESQDNMEARLKGMSDEEINSIKVNEDRAVTVTNFELEDDSP